MNTKTKTQLANEEMFDLLIKRNGNSTWHVSDNNDLINCQSKRFGLNMAVDCGIVIKHSRGYYSIPNTSSPCSMAAILREHCRVNSSERNKKRNNSLSAPAGFHDKAESIMPKLEYCIERVKAAGLKVLQQTSEWKEI